MRAATRSARDRRVDALVERAARQRLQRITIGARVSGRDVGVERILVAPLLDDREVIAAHRVL